MKKVSIEINGRTLSIESGRMAKQANGSVWIQYGETAVLTTAVTGKSNRDDIDFFPLSVDYQEKFASAGKIPGGFFKREGRQSEREILISRLTDRPIRPLFPKGFQRETQIISTVFSFDKVNESDILSVLGASAALHISDIPFMGPIAAVRVGRVDGELVCNPTLAQMENAELDMVVAGSRDAIVMVEGEASQLPESVVLEALQLAHKQIQPLLDLQDELKKALGKEKIQVQTPEERISDFQTLVTERALPKIREAFGIKEKIARYQQIETFQKELIDALAEENEEYADRGKEIKGIVHDLIGQEIRKDIVENGRRMDDRSPETIREITGEVGVLPRAHGSALFTRGETQALVSATLGTSDDEQRMDSLMGESTRRFLLHYNFPAFCVGEVKPMRGPARREIGHGALAHKALMQVVPSKEEFPYSIRVVSDVLESHGSSSMATVCGGSMALMDAGVPLKAPVAGIAMGLIKEGDQFFVLSDITGDEDHVGDMDFKVAGTQTGVTAVQMDIKVTGISWDVVEKALEQAKQGRLHILGKMAQALPESRQQLSQHAPRLESFEIPKDKIREVIGTGGKVIRGIIEETGAKVEINDEGIVTVASESGDSLAKAVAMIQAIIEEAEVGKTYKGKVVRIEAYGAFVQILPGKDGLLHVSEFDSDERVEDVHEFFAEGDEVEVRVVGIDGQGKIKLSQKDDETRREQGLDRDRGGRGGDRGRGGRGRDRNDRGGRPPRYNRDRRD